MSSTNSTPRPRRALLVTAVLAALLATSGCGMLSDQIGDGVATEPSSSSTRQQTGTAPEGTSHTTVVRRVIDGDTVSVEPTPELPANDSYGNEHVVRLLGIDAPEMNAASDEPAECGAIGATERLTELLLPGGVPAEVTIVYDGAADRTDRFGRSLAYVSVTSADGADAAAVLVSEGLVAAWFPSGEPTPERYLDYLALHEAAASTLTGSHATCGALGR